MRPQSSWRDRGVLLGLAAFGIATILGAVYVTRASTLTILRDDARMLATHWAHYVDERLDAAPRDGAATATPAPSPRRFQPGQYAATITRYAVFETDGTLLTHDPLFTPAELAEMADTPAFQDGFARALSGGEPAPHYGDMGARAQDQVATVFVPVDADGKASRVIMVETDQAAAFAVVDRAVNAVVIFVATLMAAGIGMPLFMFWRRLGAHWRLREHADLLASTDALTGLPNRVRFVQAVTASLARTPLEGGHKTAVLSLDIDRFRQINDALGHPTGDRLLRHVSVTIQQAIAGLDAEAARVGGDEFAIVVRGASAQEDALALARTLRDRLAAALPAGEGASDVVASLSVGMAVGPCDGRDALTLVKHSGIALNHARAAGPNASRFYTPSMEHAVRRRTRLEQSLRRAMERDELFLLYQPQFDLVTGRITGYEALLRWDHPEEGTISPADFIASAEATGLILDLGEWTLRTACRYAADWPAPLKVAVNLSALQLHHGDIYETVCAVLEETGLPPERLELEITESLLLQNVERVQAALARLAERGVSLAVDDFGTGYSSLSYLATFRFSKIKIDRCFVSDLGANDEATTVIRTIIGLGNALGVDVVAEGIEHPEQLAFVRANGCRNVQGFLCGRPAPEILTPWEATVTASRLARPERLAAQAQTAAAEPLPAAQISA